MTDTPALRVAELPQNAPTPFDLSPDAGARAALAGELGLSALRKLRFTGRIVAHGARDWLLEGHLGATVVQPCVVTLDPVTTRIESDVRRLFLAEMPEDHDEAPEVEMPDDDTIEALGAWIDPAAVMAEALALALPLYPRKADADLGEAVFTAPGKMPMRDEDARPFAGLAGLRNTLKQGK
ncbi:YceD family protein [Antarcticimicrobium luteum]|uniref:DUF177 domain-containing protein n=1 Tax=Antarcticimicrobium luteum TaxID=2547397 RepID=A0A4R5VHT5_9RHOB|nr:DUF177 domain-containing protein [Antarcticimicrobium luteum]TDK51968.1 DUF177 domain-containing protein [Antarcticimicrobium luteum]